MNSIFSRLRQIVGIFLSTAAIVAVSLVGAQPALAYEGTTTPLDVGIPGETNDVAFTTTLTISDFTFGVTAVTINIVHTSFANPEPTAVAITVTDSAFTQCGSTGIGIKISTGTVAGTCETTTSGEYINEITFTPGAASQLGAQVFFEFGPGSVSFVATDPNSLQPLTGWVMSYSFTQSGIYSGDAGDLTVAPASGGTITFDSNGGSGTMADFNSSSPASIPLNTFTREGHYFDEWTTERNGTGTAYADGAQFPFDGDEILYAQWAEGAAPTLVSTGLDARTQLVEGMLALSFIAAGLYAVAARRRRSWYRTAD